MRKYEAAVALAALMTCSIVLSGCHSVNRRLSESTLRHSAAKNWEVHHYSIGSYILDDEKLGKIDFAGWTETDRVRVHYPEGLAETAEEIAEVTSRMIETVEQRLGVAITTRTRIELLRFDEVPQNFDIRLTSEPNEFPLPMFVPTDDESCRTILAQSYTYPYILVHELVETSLAFAATEGRVLPDISWEFYFIGGHLDNDTRWFRDGLANYAGFVAAQTLREDLGESGPDLAGHESIHSRPFSMLEAVGADLFDWSQHSRAKQQGDYYNAALGLFLLIADEYGEQAIRDINAAIASHQTVDGRDLLEIVKDITGTDLRELAATFRQPRIGVEATEVSAAVARNKGLDVQHGLLVKAVEPNSVAATAGIEPNDVIVAVNGQSIADELDCELAFFPTRRSQSVALSVYRAEAGTKPVELDLGHVQAQEPRQRRIDTRKGGRTVSVNVLIR